MSITWGASMDVLELKEHVDTILGLRFDADVTVKLNRLSMKVEITALIAPNVVYTFEGRYPRATSIPVWANAVKDLKESWAKFASKHDDILAKYI